MGCGLRARADRARPLLLAFCAAFAVASPALAGKADNSVRVALTNVVPNIDPYFNNLFVGKIIADAIWDALVRRDPATGALQPSLATAWRWIDDRTLELTLREGVRFHNGEAFGADDVVYTLSFAADPSHRISQSEIVSWIDRVEKVDAFTVRIHTRTVYPAAVSMLASAVMHPHAYYAAVGPKGMNEHPVGTGPFRVAEHTIGKRLVLERNPDYFVGGPKSAPRIDRVEIRFIPDPTTQVAETAAGSLDLITWVNRDQAEQLRRRGQLQILGGASTRYRYLQIDTLPTTPAPPLRDLRVRRAIAYAIDRETIMHALQGPDSRILHTECHPIQFGCSDVGAPRYGYDPDKARALLEEAGYPDGFDLTLYGFNPRDNVAEAVANYLDAVGIRTRLRFMEVAAVITALRNGRAAAVLGGNTLGLEDVSLTPLQQMHGFNAMDVNRDPELRDLILRGDSVFDEAERREAYRAALALIAERVYTLPLFTQAQYFVATKDLVMTPYVDGIPRFYEMYYR
jgi:peptide/nickel transport system substrate-binding protein